jgi:hypothetical protein
LHVGKLVYVIMDRDKINFTSILLKNK